MMVMGDTLSLWPEVTMRLFAATILLTPATGGRFAALLMFLKVSYFRKYETGRTAFIQHRARAGRVET
jgi:hypothetical protein